MFLTTCIEYFGRMFVFKAVAVVRAAATGAAPAVAAHVGAPTAPAAGQLSSATYACGCGNGTVAVIFLVIIEATPI